MPLEFIIEDLQQNITKIDKPVDLSPITERLDHLESVASEKSDSVSLQLNLIALNGRMM